MVWIAILLTVLLVWNLRNYRDRLAQQAVDGDISFGRAADKLAVHFLLTVCILQSVWFLWFVIA